VVKEQKSPSIWLSPRLPINRISDFSVNAGHWKKTEILNSHPFTFRSSKNWFAAENMESEFEVRKSLSENSDRLLHFDIHAYLFLNAVS
jgi:hypothetical protein